MFMNAYTVISGFLLTFLSIIGMAYMTYKVSNRYDHEQTRIGYLWALSFFMGYLVGPAMHQIAEVHPSILIQAVGCTMCMFGSFSCIALFSQRRSMLFVGGIIASISSCLFWYSTTSWLLGYSYSSGMVYMMSGLLMACLYVIFDTQLIIEQAEHGDKDVPTHTMTMFIDLFDLFIRIVRLLIELQNKEEEKERRKRREK